MNEKRRKQNSSERNICVFFSFYRSNFGVSCDGTWNNRIRMYKKTIRLGIRASEWVSECISLPFFRSDRSRVHWTVQMNWWQTSIRHHSATIVYSRPDWMGSRERCMLFLHNNVCNWMHFQQHQQSAPTAPGPNGISFQPNRFHSNGLRRGQCAFGSNGSKTMYKWPIQCHCAAGFN